MYKIKVAKSVHLQFLYLLTHFLVEWIRITRFLYANEAHNILMTGLGTHERFTIEMRTCVQRTSKKISIHKKDTKYNSRKVILGTLGFKLSF